MASEGVLRFDVWPTFLGLATAVNGDDANVREPFADINYERGQIHWETGEDGNITGHARVHVPAGIFTHYVYWSGPQQVSTVMGSTLIDEPIVFDRSGFVDVDPIKV